MSRDYETPEDYMFDDGEAEAEYNDRMRKADKEEAAIRRWEAQREMPYEDDEQHYQDTPEEHAAWLRREEYGDQDREAA